MLDLYHAEPVANSMKTLLCLKEKVLERMERGLARSKVPEVLRTFGG
jgi:hypothetical protein